MYNKTKEVYEQSLEKVRKCFDIVRNMEWVSDIIRRIDENHAKSSWVNIAQLITNILGFAAYCVISPVLAEYQREKGIRIFSMIAIALIIAIIIWELVCLAGYERLEVLGRYFCRLGKMIMSFCQNYFGPIMKVIGFLFAVFVIFVVLLCEGISRLFRLLKNKTNDMADRKIRIVKWFPSVLLVIIFACLYFYCDVTCCTSVVEIYGIPTKLGEELDGKEERENCAAYWKIKDYPFRKKMELSYVESYKQLDVMKENSTAYGMLFFQPASRIEIYYKKDKGKYHSFNQSSFEVAKNNGFREPIKISYYNSYDKLILKLEKNKYGKFDITRYLSADMPQLLNSTLLYIQNENSIENSMTSQQIEVTYNAEGLPETRRLSPNIYNANGINGEYYVYDQNRRLTTLYYLDINGEFVCNKQGIMMVDFQYEDNGNLHSIRYYGGEDREKKTEGCQGVFCERFSYDSYGNLMERSQRDRNENLRSDVNGVCIYRYHYDYSTDCRLEREEFLGFDGEPVRDNNFHSTSVKFEMCYGSGSREIKVLLDAIGSSVAVKDGEVYSSLLLEPKESFEAEKQQDQMSFLLGYHKQTEVMDSMEQDSRYDQTVVGSDSRLDSGTDSSLDLVRRQEAADLSKQGNRRLNEIVYAGQLSSKLSQGTPVSQDDKKEEQENEFKSGDNMEIYLDEEADIIRNYVSIRYIMDRTGCVSEKGYCDSKGNLVIGEAGYAAIHFDYDKQKRITHERYLDNKSNPCCTNAGYAIVRKSYEPDQSDDIKSIEYLINDDELVRNRELGYAYVEYIRTLEEKNKLICKKYFDEEHNPVPLPDLGYVMAEEYYDERNFLIWEAYYAGETGEYERTCRDDYGVAEIWYEYDDSGNRIRELYKDVEKQLVNRSDTGYAAVYWKYEGGQMIDCHYEGNQNQMLSASVDRKTGIAGIKYTYENGKKVKEEYYDTQGNPSFRTDIGCVAKEFGYNDRGRICEESYYGLDGEAVRRKDTGYAMAAYQDNEYGQRISVRFYDTDKQLVISTEDQCAGYDYSYDSEGNEECVKYIGLDGKMMTRRDLGYAQVHYDYDGDGNITEGRYLDTEGKLAVRKERGYAYYTSKYDEKGNWLESCYYKAEDTPVLRQDTGYFKIENEYDKKDGELISQKFYGTDGKQPVISTKYCCAGFEFEYDHSFENEFDFEYERNERGIRKTTTYIGIDGRPMVRIDLGYAKSESVYDVEGRKISAVFKDADGNITVGKEGGYAAFRDVYKNGNWVESQFYGVNYERVLRKDTGYAVVINEYDEYGQRIRENYYNENYKPIISTKYHCAGFLFEYDEKGNKTHVKYLDTDGKMMVRRDLGYAQMEIGYDCVGNKVSETYFNTKGQPAVWKEGGYASYRSKYDGTKWMETRYYDKKGELTLRNDEGYAVIKNEYDVYGQRTEQTYYDNSEVLKPVISKEHHCAGFKFEYDDMGNRVYTSYLDLDGNLMVRRDLGYAQVVMEYDYVGNKRQEAYFDLWGNPAIDKEGGYSYYRNDYDESGRLKEIAYFIDRKVKNRADMLYDKTRQPVEDGKDSIDETGQEGESVLRKDMGYAKVKYDYDDYGQKKQCLYYGADGQPVISTKYLCAGFEYAYDEKGNETDIYYLGLEKEQIVRRDLGVAHIQKEYDIWGNLEKELYFDNDGPAAYNKCGYVSYKNIFKNNQIMETRYLDAKENPIINGEKGYAIVRYEYDRFGQCISESYYGADKKPVISKEDYCAGCEYKYDEAGNQTEKCYVDKDGSLIICRDLGYARVRKEYDECGNKIGESYYDTDDNPAIWKEGGAVSCKYKYDRGKCVEWRCFNGQGDLVLRRDTGYAIIRYEHDDYGQCIGESYYDIEEESIFRKDYQCAGRQFGYDEKGNQTEFRCIGLDGNPMIWGESGYAQIECEFDHFNNKTKEVYLDINGNPVVRQQLGYAQTQWEYDESGRMSKEAYFDEAGQAAARKEGGYVSCSFYYDDEEHMEEKRYFDVNDSLTLCNDEGYAIIRYFYDEFGQIIKVDYWDTEYKRAVNRKNCCAQISYEYDERGNNTYIWYWDTEVKVAERPDTGIAMEHIVYNDYGYIITREYYKDDPKDAAKVSWGIHKDLGYACVNYVYEGNVWIRTEYFDAEINYMAPKGIGYAIYEREYNDMWQLSRESYRDADEELVNYVDKRAAIVEYTYDDWGYTKSRVYYNKMEELLY